MLKTQNFEKMHSFQGMRKLRQFYPALMNTKNVSEQYIRVHNVFQQVWCNLYDHFLRTKKSRTKKLIFSKLKLSSRRKKKLALFLSYYPLCQTLDILLLGSTRYLGLYGASCKIFSLGPKRLFKTHIFWKKANFPVKKCICPIFFQIVECAKPQETFHKSKKDFSTFNVQVRRVFLRPERLLKTQIFEKNHSFQGMKKLRQFYPALTNTKNVSEQYIRVHNVFQQVWCNLYDHFLRTKKSRTKKLIFSKLKPSSRRKKDFGPFFLLLPTITDIGYSFVRLHKVSSHLWCKL